MTGTLTSKLLAFVTSMVLLITLLIPSIFAQNKSFIPQYKQQAIALNGVDTYEPLVLSKNFDLLKFASDYTGYKLNQQEIKRIQIDKPKSLFVSIPLTNGAQTLVQLIQSNPIAKGKGVYTQAGKIMKQYPYQHGLHYKGVVRGKINSTVAMSFFENTLMGFIFDETGNYDIGAVNVLDPKTKEYVAPTDLLNADYVLSEKNKCKLIEKFSCGTKDLPSLKNDNKKDQNSDETMVTASCKNIVIYFECDSFLYKARGSSVPATVSFVTGMFNALNVIYANDNIHVSLGDIKVWTLNDPYKDMTQMGPMLDELRINQIPINPFTWNLCALLTTKRRDWGGLAYLNILCANRGIRTSINYIYNSYSPLPAYSWTLNVLAHETGHNFGSNHTQWCGWSGGAIDGCVAVEGGCTRPPAANPGTIMSYCHVATSVDLNLGYGPLPGDKIRTCIANSACLPLFDVTANIVYPTPSPYQLFCNGTIRLQAATCSGCSYQWSLDGNDIPSATNSYYDATLAGDYRVRVSKTACATATSDPLTIILIPIIPPTISGLNSPYTNQQGPITMTGNPAGGTFSGNGVTGNQFDPSVAGVGTHSITYQGSDNGCPYSVTVDVEVIACPSNINITPGGPISLCQNQSITLSVINDPMYTYQWRKNNVNIPGATQNTYIATMAGNYSVSIGMTNCNNMITPNITITIQPQVIVRIGGYRNPYTISGPNASLIGSPAGGIFSGPGINGNIFKPSIAGAGNHTITYTVTRNGCQYTATVVLTVLTPKNCPNNLNAIITPGPTVILRNNNPANLIVPAFNQTTYQWMLNGVDIPGAIYRIYRATVIGQYQVKIQMTGCPSYTTGVCTIIPDLKLEISQELNEVKIYPNPAKELIQIEFNSNSENDDALLLILDSKGSIMHKSYLKNGINQIDLQNYSHGIYCFQILNDKNIQTHKIIIE